MFVASGLDHTVTYVRSTGTNILCDTSNYRYRESSRIQEGLERLSIEPSAAELWGTSARISERSSEYQLTFLLCASNVHR